MVGDCEKGPGLSFPSPPPPFDHQRRHVLSFVLPLHNHYVQSIESAPHTQQTKIEFSSR